MTLYLLDHLVHEKIDAKEYKELSEKTNDMRLKEILIKLSEAECEHYRMIREYLSSKIVE